VAVQYPIISFPGSSAGQCKGVGAAPGLGKGVGPYRVGGQPGEVGLLDVFRAPAEKGIDDQGVLDIDEALGEMSLNPEENFQPLTTWIHI
jgi:hypothetical protein